MFRASHLVNMTICWNRQSFKMGKKTIFKGSRLSLAAHKAANMCFGSVKKILENAIKLYLYNHGLKSKFSLGALQRTRWLNAKRAIVTDEKKNKQKTLSFNRLWSCPGSDGRILLLAGQFQGEEKGRIEYTSKQEMPVVAQTTLMGLQRSI